MPGGHSGEAIPVPIPNTEVKLSNADDTAAKWESRKLPGFFFTYELQRSLVAENYEYSLKCIDKKFESVIYSIHSLSQKSEGLKA